MLVIDVPDTELYDEDKNLFVRLKGGQLRLEHSLLSMSKWEAKHKKPFLGKYTDKTREEILDYICCMAVREFDPQIVQVLTKEQLKSISEYIQDPMTATTFWEQANRAPDRREVTSELVYYWMIELGVPVEFERWHINRLLTLIRVINAERDDGKKKIPFNELADRNRAINAARRKALNTRG